MVSKFLGENHPLEVSDKLGESLINAKHESTLAKNELYNEANVEASKAGLQLKLPNFTELAKKHIDDIESSNVLQFEPETKNLLKKLNIYKGAVKQERKVGKLIDEEGNPLIDEVETTSPTLKEANILAGRLNDKGRQFSASTSAAERNAGNVLMSLSKTLKNDIKSEIKQSGSQPLIDSFSSAEKNYQENFSDFLEKDIHQFTHGNKSSDDLVAKFLQTSNTSDKADQLNKLLKTLPEKDHDLIKYSYFSRAIEGVEDHKVVNPNKLKTLWNKLGDKQKQLLVPNPKERREFDNFALLVQKNPKAVNLMWNPNTGQVNSDIVSAVMLSHPLMSLKEIMIGRLANKLLTGEKPREEIVKRLIQRIDKKQAKRTST
jgi:hypothetical protein